MCGIETVKEYYNTNEQVRAYINAYAVHRGVSVEEAFSHLLVREYVRWIMQEYE